MENFFSEDNPIFIFVNRMADMIVLNVIFLISCVPIITIGPALTALYYVSINTWKRSDGYIWKMYTKSFKQNFKQSILMWIMLAVVGFVLGVDVWYWFMRLQNSGEGFCKVFLTISIVLFVLYALIFTYVWPIQAKFTNTIAGNVKNALSLAVTHVPETIGVWAILGIVVFGVWSVSILRVSAIFIAVSLVSYFQALIFRHVFKPYLQEEERLTPEEEADLVGYENKYADAKMEVARLAAQNAAKDNETLDKE